MPKFKSKDYIYVRNESDKDESIKVVFDVHVDADGDFYMKFPDDTAKAFEDAGVKLSRSSKGKEGYLYASTYAQLKTKVEDTCKELVSRTLVYEKIVLRYNIRTYASYAVSRTGEITPNPSREWTDMDYGYDKEPKNKWRHGNVDSSATHPIPFGLLLYSRPFIKREYKYRSGKTKIYYDRAHERGASDAIQKQFEDGYNLRWLEAVPCMAEPKDGSLSEIDYTENVAEFFVRLIKSICLLSASITDFLTPEAIALMAERRQSIFELPQNTLTNEKDNKK